MWVIHGRPGGCNNTGCMQLAKARAWLWHVYRSFPPPILCRVVPRHRYFLHVHSQRQPRGGSKSAASGTQPAFPMSALKCSDTQFAKLCGTPLEEYEAFKAQLFGDGAAGGDTHPT